ncbi:hypothetical protein CEXT_392501, partial [Caerostris extrusa]
CEDIVEKLPGGLTCQEFLQHFGARYCRHNYIANNCCRSHQIECPTLKIAHSITSPSILQGHFINASMK